MHYACKLWLENCVCRLRCSCGRTSTCAGTRTITMVCASWSSRHNSSGCPTSASRTGNAPGPRPQLRQLRQQGQTRACLRRRRVGHLGSVYNIELVFTVESLLASGLSSLMITRDHYKPVRPRGLVWHTPGDLTKLREMLSVRPLLCGGLKSSFECRCRRRIVACRRAWLACAADNRREM